ncbi:MAG: aldolase [Chloroflexi bacterium]|nr:aldolase [Chloroflexota bacterium]
MNPVKAKLQNDECAIGAWLSIPSPVTAEIIGRAGFDYACVDLQHGMADYGDALAMFQAVELGDSVPFARATWNEPGIIGRILDLGAGGVIIPMVNTTADAAAAVASCRYAPAGRRSVGPTRIRIGRPDYFEGADDYVLCIPMIETAEAVANIDDILATPGIDAVYVGPSDLAVSMGVGGPGLHHDHPAFSEALATIVESCQRRGVVPGIHTTVDLLERRVDEGFRLMTVLIDVPTLQGAVGSQLAEARAKTTG